MGIPTNHTREQRDQAMTIYAMHEGRAELVNLHLAKAELDVKIGTLRSWINRDRDRYAQIKEEIDGFLRIQRSENFGAQANMSIEVAQEATRQIAAALKRGEITLKELPKVAQGAMIAAGIAVDKHQLLSGRPTQINEDVGDVVRELGVLGVQVVMPGATGSGEAKVNVVEAKAIPAETDGS